MSEEEKEEREWQGFIDEDDLVLEAMLQGAPGSMDEEEFLRLTFVGDCPECGSENTCSCEAVEGIEDITVGLCRDCSLLWCLECGTALPDGGDCGHWVICERCEATKDEFGECGVDPLECQRIEQWMAAAESPTFETGQCAWCGTSIAEGGEVYAVGAKIREGIDFVRLGERQENCPLMPVVVAGRTVPALITANGSQAKEDGNDLLIMVCSEDCALALKDALEQEKEFIDRASLN